MSSYTRDIHYDHSIPIYTHKPAIGKLLNKIWTLIIYTVLPYFYIHRKFKATFFLENIVMKVNVNNMDSLAAQMQ